jgi:hypothetical protein
VWEQVNHVALALDKNLDPEERSRSITLLARCKRAEALQTLKTIVDDERDPLQVRVYAVNGLLQLDKREVFPLLPQLLTHKHPDIRKEAIDSAHLLADSRMLFPLVNLYHRLDPAKEEDALARYAILRALGQMGDPRATGFLDHICVSPDQNAKRLAEEARRECAGNSMMRYTFAGDEEKYRIALRGTHYQGAPLYDARNLLEERVQRFLTDARQPDGLCYATYVVLPDDEFHLEESSTCHLILAPRRSEHVTAARGKDVLAAGEIGIDPQALTIPYIDNHSAGYLPDASSFAWVSKALEHTELPLKTRAFSSVYPPNGYFTEDFLSQQLLAQPRH